MDIVWSFRHREVLLALVVPAALLVWTWRRRGRAVALPFDHGRAAAGRWLHAALRSAESLPALLLAIVILLLAGPRKWDEPRSRRVLTNIEFCVDVSGSMGAKFGDSDRYGAAMDAINAFIGMRKGDAFGLTFFGNSVLHWVPLTTDVTAIRCAPPFMRPGQLPPWFGGTEIGKALLACRKVLLEREQGDRMIVLVTDGLSADLGGGREQEIARQLQADGITVWSIHVAEPPVPEPISVITSMTGGEAFAPEDAGALDHVFQRIDRMQRTRMEKSQAESADDFVPFALAGLGALALLLLALLGLRATPW